MAPAGARRALAPATTSSTGATNSRSRRRKGLGAFAWASAALFVAPPAGAVRPFITDDARVVGDRAAQLETWLRGDRRAFQHWVAGGVGPVAPLEVTLGGVYGREDGRFAYALPLIQLKALAVETKPGAGWPGVALAVGGFGPSGPGSRGHLRPANFDRFGYVALTQSVLPGGDDLLLHQNVGLFVAKRSEGRDPVITWGVGTQARLWGGLHFVGEIFSGDPYAAASGAAVQAGARYFVSSVVQVDSTVGRGIWGEPALPLWGTLGLRIASAPNFW
ncbi:MAG TPA: hypothetical protein VFS00_07120 [Polyangiaceae bacterium]|nr:hypothetical protein [Polyangiaceae bacterium]